MEEKNFVEKALTKMLASAEEDYEMPSKDGLLRELRTSAEEDQKLKQYERLLEDYGQSLQKMLEQMKETMEVDNADEQGTGDLWLQYAMTWQNNGIDPELSSWFSDAFGNNTSTRGGGKKL